MQKTIIPTLMFSMVLLSSCGILSPVVTPEIKQYQMTSVVSGGATCKPKADAPILQVSPVRVFAPFDTRNMYYSVAEYQLNSYSFNQWATMPSSMFSQAILQKLQNSCIYSDVSSAEFMITAKYRLTNQVMDFKQVINSDTSTMNLNVVSQLIDNSSNIVIKNKTFVETVNVESSPAGYVKGANEVTNAFTNDLVTWLSTN